LLKVEVREGSNELWASFEPLIRQVIDKMSAENLVELVKYGIFCGTGLWGLGIIAKTFRKDREHAREMQAKTEKEIAASAREEKTLRVLEKAVEKIGSVVTEDSHAENYFAQPIRNYANQLDPEDSLSIAGSPPMKVKKVRSLFRLKRRPRSRTRWSGCDGAYICTGLDLEQKIPRLRIEQGDVAIMALIGRLSNNESSALINKIKERMEKQEMPFRLNLQLNVYFTNAGIKYATVVGVGSRREQLYPHKLQDIPSNVVEAFDEFSTPESDKTGGW
jgi:hypothetical protein